MCGITGLVSSDKKNIFLEKLKRMTDVIAHRGPDGEGHWISKNGHVALGHRRLSVIDLSHAADQPMHYLERYTIIFNGEIYNYIELKDALIKQGYHFTTESDTEVLMALYQQEKENCLQLLDGMFAFVIYDDVQKEIFAARDRFGEKPFFYSYKPGKYFLFGSEMKALWAGGIEKKINNRMLYNYLAYDRTDNPQNPEETFYENCTRLPHGHYLKLSLTDYTLSLKKYYDINWKNVDQSITVEQAKGKFHELFYTSVKRRLRSDVTVGSSLSGGLDSSLVVTVIDKLKRGNGLQQDTFSAIFPGFKKDEKKFIDCVIAKTNVSPHFVTPDDKGLIADIDKLTWHQEEPYGSASIYAQYCVMRLAKENNVTVLLDGQGADEILAGYHAHYLSYFRELRKSNRSMYAKEKNAYHTIHADNSINSSVLSGFKNKLKLTVGDTYIPFLQKWYYKYKHLKNPFLDNEFSKTYADETFDAPFCFTGLNHALYHQTLHGNLQELLRYADRNSMAHGREIRLPFLYHELVEFLFTLPSHMKIHGGWTKWIMRETFDRELPPEIRWRTDKIGYEPPQQNWLENKMIREKISSAKKKLVNNHILTASVLKKETGQEANWKFLLVGTLLS